VLFFSEVAESRQTLFKMIQDFYENMLMTRSDAWYVSINVLGPGRHVCHA